MSQESNTNQPKEPNWQPYASGVAAAVFFFLYENYKHLVISRLQESTSSFTTKILMSILVGVLFGFYIHFRRKRLKAKNRD